MTPRILALGFLIVLNTAAICQGLLYFRRGQKAYNAGHYQWQCYYQTLSEIWSAAAVVVTAIAVTAGALS